MEKMVTFSELLIPALLDGTKTMTRRIDDPGLKPGDTIIVRENYYQYGAWQKNGTSPTGRLKWEFVPFDLVAGIESEVAGKTIFFTGELPDWIKIRPNSYKKLGFYKRISRFMPKTLARVRLEVTAVRREPLQDISNLDAMREGIKQMGTDKVLLTSLWTNYASVSGLPTSSAVNSFQTLWELLHGLESWIENPEVTVLSFRLK